tara:strand:+ start:178 stop:477 length:300 start_codon:yes stop_codon:yes gene_type:complete
MKQIPLLLLFVLLVSCSKEVPSEVPSDKLVERQGLKYEINSTTPFSGSTVHYHDNGQLQLRCSYKDGKKDGLWEWYHDNGQLILARTYKDDKLISEEKF